MTPHARVDLELPDGEIRSLFPGDLIGRSWSAALQLNDASVSECHALVSLRGRDLKLLALRGRFAVQGRTRTALTLQVGQDIAFTQALTLRVIAVEVPDEVLGIRAQGVPEQVVPGVSALFGGRQPRLEAGRSSAASGHLWPTGDGWMRTGSPPIPVAPGDTWTLDGVAFEAVLCRKGGVATTRQHSAIGVPLRIVARYDAVHILRPDRPALVLSGRAARLLSELAILGQPIHWAALAADLWGDGIDVGILRHRWDMLLSRLRKKLHAVGVRADLVRADGVGLIQLVLDPGDVLVDET